MQPNWDSPQANEDDYDDDLDRNQVQVSLQDILNSVFAVGGAHTNSPNGANVTGISLQDIRRLLSSAGAFDAAEDDDEDYEEEDDDDEGFRSSFRSASSWRPPEITEPQKEGVELLNSGDFGRHGGKAQKRNNNINVARLILDRTRGRPNPSSHREDYAATPTVYMTNISDDSQTQTAIPFSDHRPTNRLAYAYDESFGIWSCRFSADGNEVVAGGSGKIFVYDLLANRRTVKIAAHADDVNSCCWADTASGNVLISASDDTFIKVWDRRSLGASQKPSGVLIGHTEGITYVSAKGDGRYLVSNGKDQTMRLWDLRRMRSSEDFESVQRKRYGASGFDYRYPPYPGPRVAKHPKDCSIMTYYGHSVMRTLIRCHFSPMETTGAKYLYSGSSDGRIHIWSLDGRVVQILDRSKTLPMSFDPSDPEFPSPRSSSGKPCVRDVSWHSQEPVIMSAAWETSYGGSTVARHEWKGLLKMCGSLETWVEKDRLERQETSRRPSAPQRRPIPGAFEDDEEDDDDTE
ncbi:hypothetical protein H0H93_005726 [Arthromyces matolae]|nr:hypothetical protein H0H93_005726 [Arthromyces matolae]